MGVKIETNKVIGKTFTVPQLMKEKGYDAVFLGVGAGAPAFIGIPGESASQVYSANEFLTRVNLMGGDTSSRTRTRPSRSARASPSSAPATPRWTACASRSGSARPTVRCVYRRTEAEAPARIEEIRHAKEEGIEFFFLHAPVEVHRRRRRQREGHEGRARWCSASRTRRAAASRCRPGSSRTSSATRSSRARHEGEPDHHRSRRPGLALNKWGNIAADDGKLDSTQATNLPGVFAGGDIVTGGATVILAMGAGRRAARSIATYL